MGLQNKIRAILVTVIRPRLLIFLLFPGTAFAEYHSECSQLLLQQPFLKPLKYAQIMHKRLVAADPDDLKAISWSIEGQGELDSIASQFSYSANGSTKLRMKFETLRDPQEKNPHVVLLATFFLSQTPVGFVARKMKRDRGALVAYGSGFYLDPNVPEVRGVSAVFTRFLDSAIYRRLGVVREKILADYVGRYVWAKSGFDFDTSKYYWTGARFESPTVKPIVLVRENLSRFLRKHKVLVRDLIVQESNGISRSIRALSDLTRPSDFALLAHRSGRLLEIEALIAEDTLGPPQAMPIGKAFMFSDHRPLEGQLFISSPMGTRFSKTAMPKWYAVREIEN